jgi:hypothetical protein
MQHQLLTLMIRNPFADEDPQELRRQRRRIAEMIVEAEDREAKI